MAFDCLFYFERFSFKYVRCGGAWRPIFNPTQTQETEKSQFEQSANKQNYALKPSNRKPNLDNQLRGQTTMKVAIGIDTSILSYKFESHESC